MRKIKRKLLIDDIKKDRNSYYIIVHKSIDYSTSIRSITYMTLKILDQFIKYSF